MKLEKTAIATTELDAFFNEYTQVAKRGSVIFFSMISLLSISSMYEYSLASFPEIFIQSLKRSSQTPVIAKRINNILNVLTQDFFDYVLVSVF